MGALSTFWVVEPCRFIIQNNKSKDKLKIIDTINIKTCMSLNCSLLKNLHVLFLILKTRTKVAEVLFCFVLFFKRVKPRLKSSFLNFCLSLWSLHYNQFTIKGLLNVPCCLSQCPCTWLFLCLTPLTPLTLLCLPGKLFNLQNQAPTQLFSPNLFPQEDEEVSSSFSIS